MDRKAFGRNLGLARKIKQLTSKELAERLNLNASYIRQLECGARTPSMDVLIAICNELGTVPEFLLQSDLSAPSDETAEFRQFETALHSLTTSELRMFRKFLLGMYSKRTAEGEYPDDDFDEELLLGRKGVLSERRKSIVWTDAEETL